MTGFITRLYGTYTDPIGERERERDTDVYTHICMYTYIYRERERACDRGGVSQLRLV